MKSSYGEAKLNYGHIFQLLVGIYQPKVIVEFGVLEGFSLLNMVQAGNSLPRKPIITTYDIFDKFNGNHAEPEIREMFKEFDNVTIKEGDFFEVHKEIPERSIDLLHIDIANDGGIYQFAVEKYLSKLTPEGIMVLEGGSQARDEVGWMIKYNKPKIAEYLQGNFTHNFDFITVNIFPSLTVIRPKK